MRRFLAPLALAGLLALPTRSAVSQTSLSVFQQFGPATTVLYIPFHVAVGGTFRITTSGLNLIDPMLRLFAGKAFTGADLGTALAFNDDGGAAQAGWNICTGAGGTCHSLITVFLAAGDYTVATGAFNLTEAEARAGVANFGADAGYGTYCNRDGDWSDCNFTVALTSTDGAASVVPEPVSLVLLASGLTGIGGVIMRRRHQTA